MHCEQASLALQEVKVQHWSQWAREAGPHRVYATHPASPPHTSLHTLVLCTPGWRERREDGGQVEPSSSHQGEQAARGSRRRGSIMVPGVTGVDTCLERTRPDNTAAPAGQRGGLQTGTLYFHRSFRREIRKISKLSWFDLQNAY